MQAASSFGMILSPILGSLLYQLGGYNVPFYSFASLFILAALSVNSLIHESVDGELKIETKSLLNINSSFSTIDSEFEFSCITNSLSL